MSVKHTDSVGKILSYLDNAATSRVVLSALFFRDYTCPANCGGCCPKFSLDFFEGERWEEFKRLYPEQLDRFTPRVVEGVTVYTDFQKDNDTRWCRNLNLENGRCMIHRSNPFTCEFELLKLMRKDDSTYVINKLYGRGWSYQRVDGGRGALCEMLPFNFDKLLRDMSLLRELNDYAQRFMKKTKLSRVIKYLEDNLESFRAGKTPKNNIDFLDEENPQTNLF